MKHEIVKKLGVGSAGDAYLLKNGQAIIVGKREDSYSTYEALHAKLKVLDGKITAVKYPKIYELIQPCAEYPYGAIVEECISGVELRDACSSLTSSQKQQIGKTLADFVYEVHNSSAVGSKEDEMNINLSKYDRSLGILREHIDDKTFDKLVTLKQDYKNLMENKDFCITLGDLNAGNIMINSDGGVSGVIDFANMEYYIPEIEFVHMYFFDREIYDAMVQNYPKSINEKEIILLELIVNVRHFKNIKTFEDRRKNCLSNINGLLKQYMAEDDASKTY